MREILILCLMVLAGFLSACDDSNKPPANTGKYAPVLNPHPKHFFVVNGHVDTALRTTTNLVLKMTY